MKYNDKNNPWRCETCTLSINRQLKLGGVLLDRYECTVGNDPSSCAFHNAYECGYEQAVRDVEPEIAELASAIENCVGTFYVGGGKVVAPGNLKPHLDYFAYLLLKKSAAE
jgi:hypothetical protein